MLTAPGAPGAVTARAAITGAGGQVVTAWPQIGVTVGVAPDRTVDAVVRKVRGVRGIQQAGVSGAIAPEAPRYPRVPVKQPKLKEVPGDIAAAAKAPLANRTATGQGVTLGIADTGLIDESSEFAGRFDAKRSGACTNGGAFRQTRDSW